MPGVVELIGALIGSKVSGGGGGGSTSAPASALAANTAANQLNPAQLASAIRATSGNVQTNTSGSVAPDYLSQLIQTQYGSSAGNPGVVGQQSAQQWGGSPSFGTPGSTNQVPFGNAATGGLGNTGLSTPANASGFNISEWLQRLQGQEA